MYSCFRLILLFTKALAINWVNDNRRLWAIMDELAAPHLPPTTTTVLCVGHIQYIQPKHAHSFRAYFPIKRTFNSIHTFDYWPWWQVIMPHCPLWKRTLLSDRQMSSAVQWEGPFWPQGVFLASGSMMMHVPHAVAVVRGRRPPLCTVLMDGTTAAPHCGVILKLYLYSTSFTDW